MLCVNLCMRVFTREIYRWLNGNLVVSLNATYGTHQCSNKHASAVWQIFKSFRREKKRRKLNREKKQTHTHTQTPKKFDSGLKTQAIRPLPLSRIHFTYISFAYSFVQFPILLLLHSYWPIAVVPLQIQLTATKIVVLLSVVSDSDSVFFFRESDSPIK